MAIAQASAAVALTGLSEFDGFAPPTFAHADTLDSSRNRLAAGRLWSRVGDEASRWSGQVAASLLSSSNRNYLADDPLNRTSGTRRSRGGSGYADRIAILPIRVFRRSSRAFM